jgi:hypothetical protein
MVEQLTRNVLRVFLASPGDVIPERHIAREVVDELNRIFSRSLGWHIELLGWEDTMPGAGRPQERINADVDACDLFVSVVWARWGSPTGKFESGFEEEFERARARHQESGKPERWLFFKQVESDRLRDPGPQLQRVQAFRTEQIALREVLFKEFTDPNEWRDLLRETLSRYLLDLAVPQLRGESITAPAETGTAAVAQPSPDASPFPQSSEEEPAANNTQIVNLMRSAAGAASEHDFSTTEIPLDRFDVARLYLFAATLMNGRYTQDLLGVHEVNIMYLYKEQFEFISAEQSLLLRTLIGDSNDVVPGCYWFRNLPPDEVVPLLSLAARDSNASVRLRAIEILENLEINPSIAFPQKENLRTILTDENFQLRTAGFNYLTTAGTAEDIALIDAVLSEGTGLTFHNAALLAKLAIISKTTPEEAFKGLLANPQLDAKRLLEQLELRANEISTDVLLSGIKHQKVDVRDFVVRQLRHRKSLSPDLAASVLEDSSESVKEIGYIQLVEQGVELDPKKVFDSLKGQWTVRRSITPITSITTRENPNAVMMELLKRLPPDTLKENVDWFTTLGAMAYKALGVFHFHSVANEIRSDLENDFARIKQLSEEQLRASYGSSADSFIETLKKSESFLRGEFTVAGLAALAINGVGEDVEIGRRYLTSTDPDVIDEAVRIVERLGHSTDADALVNIARSYSHNQIGALAARAALKLSPGIGGAVRGLLAAENADLAQIAVNALLDEDKAQVGELLKPFLYSKIDGVRIKVLAFFVKRCSMEELEELLTEYPTSSNTHFYYYNVVCHLDRVLYAPQPLKKLCRRDIESELDARVATNSRK